jgi:predicted nucleic acid-binding protein
MLADVQSLPIEIAPADQEAVLAAAHLKAGFSISYADAFAAATAQMHHAILLTGDPEFKALVELLQVEWLTG